MKPSLPINEYFLSVQGEGVNSGRLALFLRFGKCNLNCSFCDTRPALTQYRNMSPAKIQKVLKQYKHSTRFIVLTGGEPLLHDLTPLIKILKRESFTIAVETNGTLYKNWLQQVDWITVSPKPGSTIIGKTLETASELKFVITRTSDLKFAEQFMPFSPAFLMPANNKKKLADMIFAYLKKSPYAGHLKLGFQMQKVFQLQ
ncbi:MAG: 7-carboxy-7-deazaguanine synthase QueE [bacterium]|nr:7-carboxy-7-deazaguanine synthase QueE [bacterium]